VTRSDPRPVIHHARYAVRLFRYAVYLSIGVMLWWLLSTYAFVSLEPEDASVDGVSGYHRLLVERLDENDPLERGDRLVFAMLDAEGRQIFRVSRVHGLPGDRLEENDGTISVNGEPTEFPATQAIPLPGTIEQGYLFLVNDIRLSPFADSLRLGLIPRSCVIGRFLAEMPF
jgi:hypothetical protein